MDDARAAGLKVAVCSAATKSSVVFTLKNLLGEQRFGSLDVFLAGEQGAWGAGGTNGDGFMGSRRDKWGRQGRLTHWVPR